MRLALIAALSLLLAVAAADAARATVRVGIGDQNATMFDDAHFQALGVKRVRFFIPWNAIHRRKEMTRVRAYLERARLDGIAVLVHISTDDLRPRRARLPSVAAYRRDVGRLVRALRPLGVREWGAWNEANHPSQPTWNRPDQAAAYYRALRDLCPGCQLVALDVLDQRGVAGYVDRFYRALPGSVRRSARLVGVHDYGDVNRRTTSGTRGIIAAVRAHVHAPRFWLTETGAIVGSASRWPCSQSRAANRLGYLFTLLRQLRGWIDRAYVYNWYGTSCRTRMDTGVVGRDGRPRPSYAVLRRGMSGLGR